MNPELLNKCVVGAFTGTMTFGGIVENLTSDGVEWYSANLLIGVTTHYATDGSHRQVKWPAWTVPTIADAFNADEVVSSIPAGFSHTKIPPQRYAVFAHSEHVSTLNQTVAAIFQRWLPASGHEIGHGDPDAPDVIERYGENFDLQTDSRSNFRSL